MKYNVDYLTKLLHEAGIKCSGCNEDGVVWDIDGKKEIQNQKTVKQILTSYDPAKADEYTPETIDDKIKRIVNELIGKK